MLGSHLDSTLAFKIMLKVTLHNNSEMSKFQANEGISSSQFGDASQANRV